MALVDASPDIASLVVNGMLTLVLFQPFMFGAGEGVPKVSTGGVASRLTVTELLAVPPPEMTLHVKVTPAVSVVTLLLPQPFARDDAGWRFVDRPTHLHVARVPAAIARGAD